MKNLHVGDLAANHGGGITGEQETDMLIDAGDIWLDEDEQRLIYQEDDDNDLIGMNGDSIFNNNLPPLPDFPCMSSSGSSATTPAAAAVAAAAVNNNNNNPLVSSSSSSSASSSASSAASWAVLRSDGGGGDENNRQQHQGDDDLVGACASATLQSTASMDDTSMNQGLDGVDCMDMMETFGYMDLLDGNDFFDPSAIFDSDNHLVIDRAGTGTTEDVLQQDQIITNNNSHQDPALNEPILVESEKTSPEDDLATVFLEWLKSNKESVSAEDLRKVKIKKATIESAARRLGGGKEGMKQLLKLILEWVQTNHLQKRRNGGSFRYDDNQQNQSYQQLYQDPFIQNPNPNSNSSVNTLLAPGHQDPSSCYPQSPWNILPPPPPPPPPSVYVSDNPGYGYMGSATSYQSPSEYHHHPMIDSPPSWGAAPPLPQAGFSMANVNAAQYSPFPEPGFNGYGNLYPYPYVQGSIGDGRLMRLGSSATKEARKKRMARQRRLMSAHGHRNHSTGHSNHHQSHSQNGDHARMVGGIGGGDNCVAAAAAAQLNAAANWVYWPNVSAAPQPTLIEPPTPVDQPAPAMQRQVDRRQGWKPEKNLRFLLQKVLKQSDVGNLGRIVLPKKEAETHLPELEARDGISIAMEDIGTSRVWNMRYRFWPNNKSRMYLLENTGEFVKTNGLQEGDFIVIYSDVKCGKYLIRGVKVRQPAGPKPDPATAKRQSKSQRSNHSSSPSTVN